MGVNFPPPPNSAFLFFSFPPFQDAEPKLALKFMNLYTEAGKGNEVLFDENRNLQLKTDDKRHSNDRTDT